MTPQAARGTARGCPVQRQTATRIGSASKNRHPAQAKGGTSGTVNLTATALPPHMAQQSTAAPRPAASSGLERLAGEGPIATRVALDVADGAEAVGRGDEESELGAAMI